MIKSVKNRECWLFNQSWYIRDTSSTLPIQDKKRSSSSMNRLDDILLGVEKNAIKEDNENG